MRIKGKHALMLSILLIVLFSYYMTFNRVPARYQVITLFFPSADYLLLESEDRKLLVDRRIREKLIITMRLLIYGSLNYKGVSLIPLKTDIRSLFFTKGELHINLSRDFLEGLANRDDIPSKKKGIVISSIVATFF